MARPYQKEIRTVYDIRYYFVWKTKCSLPILKGAIGVRARELIKEACKEINLEVIEGKIKSDQVHLVVSCPTDIAPSKIAQYLKGKSAYLIGKEFKSQGLWERGYFCQTVKGDQEEELKKFLEGIG